MSSDLSAGAESPLVSALLPLNTDAQADLPPGTRSWQKVRPDRCCHAVFPSPPEAHTNNRVKLPNAENAVVDDAKLATYLLNHDHPQGTHKARYLGRFGFTRDDLPLARSALLKHGRSHEVARVAQTGFGPRYAVEGILETPDGRNPFVRTVWPMDDGEVAPRLITAYPLTQ